MKLLQHFGAPEINLLEAGAIPLPFDGYVLGQDEADLSRVDQIPALKGKIRFRYFNIFALPPPEWLSPWFDWIRLNIPPLKTADGREAIAWYGEGRHRIWNWPRVGGNLAESLIEKQLELTGSSAGIFLDLFWRSPRPWMFDRVGPQYGDFSPAWWHFWRGRIERYLAYLRARGKPVLVNGDDSAFPPLYLEHAEWDWERTVDLWLTHEENVLSVEATDSLAVELAIQIWLDHPGRWLAFTTAGTNLEAVNRAYEKAHHARS